MDKPNKPARIANLLSKSALVQQRILKRVQLLNKVNGLFYQIVSPSLQEHCQVTNLAEETLVISADSSVWASRLRYEQRQILSQLQANPEIPPLRRLRIQVRPPRGNQNHRPIRHAAPLSENSVAALQDTAETVENPKLKKALQRLALRASQKN